MKFELNENQVKKLDEWKSNIKAVYGECGNFEYRFRPTGIGYGVSVWSDLAHTKIDLTDVSYW